MDLGIKGETALVVGASEGIGYESAKGLLDRKAGAVAGHSGFCSGRQSAGVV
jgi:NAD(P)-dependent dehydrogenase (short-subunit alcohol dehydrogenase family)